MKERFKQLERKIRKHRKLLGGAALLAAVALIFTLVNSPAIVGVSATTRKLPIYCVKRDNKCVSLTFDAAWGDVRVRQSYLQGLA